jgi:fatty acid-binding protein DegV
MAVFLRAFNSRQMVKIKFELEICPVGPVIGAHIGPGTVGLCYYPMSPQIKELY